MARCLLGEKKLRNSIQPLMPDGFVATRATTRGGNEHGFSNVWAKSPKGYDVLFYVNYMKKEFYGLSCHQEKRVYEDYPNFEVF